jgi:DNA-directed RNA polymerase subunit RPC12/RpoP
MQECLYCGWDITHSETPKTERELVYSCWRCGKSFTVVNPVIPSLGTEATKHVEEQKRHES